MLALIALVCALAFTAAGSPNAGLVALIVGVVLVLLALVLVSQADQGIREEQMLSDWLRETLSAFS